MKQVKKLWLCRRDYACNVRSGRAFEAFVKPFKRLCHHYPAKECLQAKRCLAVPIVVDFGKRST